MYIIDNLGAISRCKVTRGFQNTENLFFFVKVKALLLKKDNPDLKSQGEKEPLIGQIWSDSHVTNALI